MPFALPHSTWIAFTPRTDGVVKLHSIDFNQTAAFSLSSLEKSAGWIEYVQGVAWALQKRGQVLNGFEGIVQSDVPIGAGLSSSAAIELASLYAFSTSSNFNLQALEAALIAQEAEREWVGTNCGVMDQIISATGKLEHALFLDCRSLAFHYVSLANTAVIVVMDTGTRRALKDSRYNERRAECEAATLYFQKNLYATFLLKTLNAPHCPIYSNAAQGTSFRKINACFKLQQARSIL